MFFFLYVGKKKLVTFSYPIQAPFDQDLFREANELTEGFPVGFLRSSPWRPRVSFQAAATLRLFILFSTDRCCLSKSCHLALVFGFYGGSFAKTGFCFLFGF